MDQFPAAELQLILSLAIVPRRRGWLWMGVIALAVGSLVIVNLPMVAAYLPFLEHSWAERLSTLGHPFATMVGNFLVIAALLWSLAKLGGGRDPRRRLARKLKASGDLLGAADVLAQAGHSRDAFELYRTVRAWTQAAAAAQDAGLESEAAVMLQRAGGAQLAEAARLFRRTSQDERAQQCEHEYAGWQMQRGHFEDAIEPWMSAGEAARAVRAAVLALEKRRLKPSQPAFRVALRAAEKVRDFKALARFYELEDSWAEAARAWRTVGDHDQAAQNFRRAGLLDEAAQEEEIAGNPQASARLRMQKIAAMNDRLQLCRAQGSAGAAEVERIESSIRSETDRVIPVLKEQGMESELIELLGATGRIDEAIQGLVDAQRPDDAADLARHAQKWGRAARILEALERWGEASDVWELEGDFSAAARCAELAGEDERALQLYRALGQPVAAAECMARLGLLQDALVELAGVGEIEAACAIVKRHPGPLPDIPVVVLDMAAWLEEHASLGEAIACLQRAVNGVALRANRLRPALSLAALLHRVGDDQTALAQVDRILDFDYSIEEAQDLKRQIVNSISEKSSPDATRAGGGGEVTPAMGQQRYEIMNELGRGGMGVVYRARDTRLEREVAIKVLRTTSLDEAARLEQEAKLAATLNHPGIVTVYDFEAGFDGYFIAMEYVPGETLDRVLKSDHGLILTFLVPLLARLAEAVAYAHNCGVIHRDLKPGNVIMTPGRQVKILDFGIAARIDAGSTNKQSVVGTPFYMAPEQIRGKVPTPATDVYSFGATAFHLATGRPPFKKGNVIEAHLSETPPNPLDLNPELPPALATIILNCLEKDPARRYASGTELSEALRRL